MKILMIITLVCGIISLVTLSKMCFKIRKSFTNEEWNELKKRHIKKRKWSWYIWVLIFFCPVINVITTVALGIEGYKSAEKIIKEYKLLLKFKNSKKENENEDK